MTWSIGAGLEGRGVVVTGAAGGIGRAVAQAIATTGARVLAVDLHPGPVDDVVSSLDGTGHCGMAMDVREIHGHGSIVDRAQSELGEVYALANLAAVLRRRGSVNEVTEDDWDSQHGLNLKSAFFLSRTVAEAMLSAGRGGRIVHFTSQGWWTGGYGGSVVYAASKGGLTSMCRGLARTYGPHGITVNAVSPGQVETSMLRTNLDPTVYESMRTATPLGYVAQPDELAGPVVFLLSGHASYITGATLNVSGGFLMY